MEENRKYFFYYPRLINESGFKSRAAYDGARTIYELYVNSFPTFTLKILKLHLIQVYKYSNLNKVFNKFSFVILQKRTCCGKHGTLEIRTYSIEPIIMQRHLVINWNVSTVIKFQYAHFFCLLKKPTTI